MRFDVRMFLTSCLVALLVPVAAVAKDAEGAQNAKDVQGPSAVFGAGHFGGELELAGEEGQRPVRIQGRAGYIGVLDLGGDLKVRCPGKGRVQKAETEAGMVYRCAGRGGQIVLRGSHFAFRGFAMRYRALLPEGTSGSWKGQRFVIRERGDEAGERDSAAKAKPEPKPARERERDEIPSLEELAEMLAGLKG
jgi:hypothetical protein